MNEQVLQPRPATTMPEIVVVMAYVIANSGLDPGYQYRRSRIDSAIPAPAPARRAGTKRQFA